jgi:hypothetical protein
MRWGICGLLVMAVVVALLGCQRAQPAAARTPAPATAAELQAEGDGLRAAGDLDGALSAYKGALARAPEDLLLRYLVALTLAELDRDEDAVAAFTWVVEHGAPGRDEVVLARQWLGGVPPTHPVATPLEAPRPGAASVTSGGQLRGRTQWIRLDPGRPVPRLQLLLVGQGASAGGLRYGTRLALNEPYEFAGVAPGEYRLVGQVGMIRLWDLRVSVKDGQPTVVDLTEATAVAAPDALRTTAS